MSEDTMRALLRLTDVFLEAENMDAILTLVCTQAKYTIPGADEVSVTLSRNGGYETRAHTAARVKYLDEEQYKAGSGPCLDAIRQGQIFEIDSLAAESRWPTFVSSALDEGFSSTLSVPLQLESKPPGALNIYALKEDAFDESGRDIAKLFARQAGMLIANAVAFMEKDELAGQLSEAIDSRDIIGTAKGIIMEREGVSIEEAFQMLVRISQGSNMKLRDIASQLVESTKK
jgi:GAF domain-containing protein